MNTGNVKKPDFYSHIYQLTHSVKTYSVYTYCPEQSSKTMLLTNILRIEDFREKSNATGINRYLRLRTTTNWSTSEKVTGLRPGNQTNTFYGNRLVNGKKNLLIFTFSHDFKTLRIDVYRAFYPNTPKILNDIIKDNCKI